MDFLYRQIASLGISCLFLSGGLLLFPVYADNIAESTDFNVDTRDYGGSEVAQSGDFTVDTTTESSSGPTESVIFALDTRVPSPDLASSQSALFTVNTLAGVPGPLTVHGLLKSTTGAFVGGASIEIKIYGQAWWRGVSGPDGSFYPPEMKAQNYVVTVQKTGYVTLVKNVVGMSGGLRTLPLLIQPLAPVPTTQTTAQQPTTGEKSDPDGEADPTPASGDPETQLKIYSSGHWRLVGAAGSPGINPNAMTVVLSHGWLSRPGDWPLPMALLIHNNHALGALPNILAWDWESAADSLAPWPDRACKQGEALGLALRRRLGLNYGQRVHFIGHSMGTLVNRFACDTVHQYGTMNGGDIGWNPALTKPHMTLLDEAEIASVLGTRVITSATIGAITAGWAGALREAAVTAYQDWKSPIPATPTSLVDSYISMVGIQRDKAVNVCLTAPAIGFMNPIDAHGYAHQWYRNSAQSPFSPILGFTQAYERGGTLPPSGNGLTPGSLWYEKLSTPALLDLALDPNPTSLECNLGIIGAYSIQSAATIGADPIGSAVVAGEAVGKLYKAGINWVGDKGGTLIIKTQKATANVTEKIGEGLDAANDKVKDVLNSLDPERLIDGVSRSTFQILLGGGGVSARGAGGPESDGPGSTEEPSAWLTLAIPANAAMMQFDFTVNGPPAEDCIAAAVAGKNVFNLPARYAPEGEVQSTDLIDVSSYAGQTLEFYFGLVGGTSSECELVIDGLRFITIPQPKLEIENHASTVSLHWPAAASGWILEASETLAGNTWQEVIPNPGALTVAEGVMRLEEARSASRQFYRLRRMP